MNYNRLKEVMCRFNEGKPKEEQVTYRTIAKSVGKPEINVKRWLNNESQPSMNTLLELANLLKVAPFVLLQSRPISFQDLQRLEKIMQQFNPCSLSLEEFKQWTHTDAYGNYTEKQMVSNELIAVLLKAEEFEKLHFLEKFKC